MTHDFNVITLGTFVEKLSPKKPVLITAKEDGIDAWFIMRIHADKITQFTRLKQLSQGDLRDYGTILESGWGEVDGFLLQELTKKHGL